MSSQNIQPTQNWIQSYLVPPDAKAVRGLLRMASRGSERSCCSQHKVIPTILVATALSALNATLFYPGRGVSSCLAHGFNWQILTGIKALACDVLNSLRSLAFTVVLVVCVAISIFYPKIIQKVTPLPPRPIPIGEAEPVTNNVATTVSTPDNPPEYPNPIVVDGPDPRTYELRKKMMQQETKISTLEMAIEVSNQRLKAKESELDTQAQQNAYEKTTDGRADLEKKLKDALSEIDRLKPT